MNLNVEYLGIAFENPFVLASAPPTANATMIRRAFEIGWAGAVIKTLIPEKVSNVCNRFAALKLDSRLMAFQNFELLSERSPDEWYHDISLLKREFPEKVVISSIMGDARNPNQWIDMALGSQQAGADMVELNFSCPHGYPEKGKGAAIGQNAEYAAAIVSWLKDTPSLTIPIIPKLTAATSDLSFIGEAVAKAGADGLSAINTIPSLMGFDLKTLAPKPSVGGYSTTGGYSGPGIKPIALRCIYELSKSPGLPLMASGGIFSGYDAAEFMLLGAPIAQICTGVMWDGYGIVHRLKDNLSTFMNWHHFESPGDFLGKGMELITSHASLDRTLPLKAHIDGEKCNGCRKCVTCCRDSGYQAIEIVNHAPTVLLTCCSGCSLCMNVCPSGAIDLLPA